MPCCRLVASRNAALCIPMGKKKQLWHLKRAELAQQREWMKAIDAGEGCYVRISVVFASLGFL